MPEGQVCGHCQQPRHNVRTCAAYAKYLEKCEELEGLQAEYDDLLRQLEEARAEAQENKGIIKMLMGTKGELERKVEDREEELRQCRQLMGFAVFGD